ncbi:50S ribosomal protein L33 [Paenibacillus sp. SAFN-117]|uniref:50S ribosomal protein L33 n=1 Tax=Paenibacillus sp. SAFN-117 TaxID=3436860 RepID=UPI0012487F24|nr:50S ribosomal protein L33 [Aneurinibacillus sp. XH2]
MNQTISRREVEKLVGKYVYAVKKDGSKVSGKLKAIRGNQLIFEYEKGKDARTKAIIPLVLFDLLAIGTSPFAFGGFPFGFGGFGGPFIW